MSLSDIVRASRARAAQAAPEETGWRLEVRGRRVLLVYLFGGLGDLVLLAPVAAALSSAGARVGVLVPPLGARVLRRARLPLRRHVLAGALDVVPRGPDARALTAELDAARYDVAVDLTLRGGVDARRWLRAPHRLGWLEAGETAVDAGLDAGVPDVRPHADRHWSRASMAPLAPLGVTAPAYDVPWEATAAARAWARQRWPRGPRVLVIPGSRSADKRWPGWPAVVSTLMAAQRARVVLSGAPWEADALRAMTGGHPRASVFVGRDLARLLALVASADLVLTNDTGPMHWAFALGRPTLALFQHMAPESWGPPVPDLRHTAWRVRGAPGEVEAVVAEATRLLSRGRGRG